MTKLTRDKRVTREVGTRVASLIVTITEEGLYTREKGTRTTYGPLGWEFLHREGAQREADRRRREKAGTRKSPARTKRGLLAVGL